MAKCNPEEIVSAVKQKTQDRQALIDRMEEDYSRYRLNPFTEDSDIEGLGEDYRHYTSNAPRTYGNKMISWLIMSQLVIRIPYQERRREEREADDKKERFLIGILKAADERLIRQLMPPLKDQLSFFAAIRGWYSGRALLVKDKDGKTCADISAWDPMHTFYEMGDNGLEWVCHRMTKTRSEVKAQYGVDLPESPSRMSASNTESDTVEIYDYYDEKENSVCTENMILKDATPHGSPRIPVYIGFVGAAPLIRSETNEDTIAEWGESIFEANRQIWDDGNLMMSILLELAARSRKPPLVIESSTGDKTLDEDPYVEGSTISVARGEKIGPLDLLEVSRDLMPLMGAIAGEQQRGSIPHTAYGELSIAISGYAINQLRQSIEAPLHPRLLALQNAYQQILSLISDQYQTGRFKAMELSGRDRNRRYFNEEITPESIKEAGDPEIKLMASLPQDDMNKMAMANMAREGPNPLLPDQHILDNILGLQDADLIADSIKEQQSERALPEAAAYSLMVAAEDRGRPELAQFYFQQLMEILMEKKKQMDALLVSQTNGTVPPTGAPPGMPPGMPPPGMSPPGVGQGVTANPQVMPNAELGIPPPMPTPQAGPNVPPGTPRPGAQEELLRQLGLFGPNA